MNNFYNFVGCMLKSSAYGEPTPGPALPGLPTSTTGLEIAKPVVENAPLIAGPAMWGAGKLFPKLRSSLTPSVAQTGGLVKNVARGAGKLGLGMVSDMAGKAAIDRYLPDKTGFMGGLRGAALSVNGAISGGLTAGPWGAITGAVTAPASEIMGDAIKNREENAEWQKGYDRQEAHAAWARTPAATAARQAKIKANDERLRQLQQSKAVSRPDVNFTNNSAAPQATPTPPPEVNLEGAPTTPANPYNPTEDIYRNNGEGFIGSDQPTEGQVDSTLQRSGNISKLAKLQPSGPLQLAKLQPSGPLQPASITPKFTMRKPVLKYPGM